MKRSDTAMKNFFLSVSLSTILCLLATPASAVPAPQFLDEAGEVELLQGGVGWTLLRLHDPEHRGEEHAREALIIRVSQLDRAPLPEHIKEDFRRDYRERGLDYRASDELLYTSPAAIGRMLDPRLWWCDPEWSTSSYSFSRDFSRQLGSDWSESFENGALSGELNVEAPRLRGEFSISAQFRVKRRCGIPFAVRFHGLSIQPRLRVTSGASLQISVEGQMEREREWLIRKIPIGSVTFVVGLIPIHLSFSVPLHAGLSIDAEASLTYTLSSSLTAEAGLDFQCDTSACRTFPNFHIDFDPPEPELALEGRAQGRIWLRPGLRVGLYSDALAFAEASAKLYLQGDLWGYLGNSCGDADGDGANELVGGLTTDLSFGVEVGLTLSGLGNDATWNPYERDWHLAFFSLDIADAPDAHSPLEPFIEAENLAAQDDRLWVGETGEWKIGMRPCYPYTDEVSFRVEPSIDGHNFDVSPEEGAVKELSFDRPGSYSYRFTAVEDEKGRTFGTRADLDIEVIAR